MNAGKVSTSNEPQIMTHQYCVNCNQTKSDMKHEMCPKRTVLQMDSLECHQPLCEQLPQVDVVGSWAGRGERLSSVSPDTHTAVTNNNCCYLTLILTHLKDASLAGSLDHCEARFFHVQIYP